MRNLTQWIWESNAVSQNTSETSAWFDAEDLGGCQFFTRITSAGSPDWTLEVELSPVSWVDYKNGLRDPATFKETLEVATGTATAAQFDDPPTEMDRPFGTFRMKITENNTAAITGIWVALCRGQSGG
jgi:hypothetical protein